MATIEQIQDKIKNMDGASKFIGKREIKELPNILWEDEDLIKLSSGKYNNGLGIIVATNKRLIFLNKGIFSFQMEDFAYNKINSIQCNTGFAMGSLLIYSSGNKAVIDNLYKDDAKYFADFIRAKIYQKDNVNIENLQNSPSGSDVINQLERLAKLKEQGILTEEEFNQQKVKILEN